MDFLPDVVVDAQAYDAIAAKLAEARELLREAQSDVISSSLYIRIGAHLTGWADAEEFRAARKCSELKP